MYNIANIKRKQRAKYEGSDDSKTEEKKKET